MKDARGVDHLLICRAGQQGDDLCLWRESMDGARGLLGLWSGGRGGRWSGERDPDTIKGRSKNKKVSATRCRRRGLGAHADGLGSGLVSLLCRPMGLNLASVVLIIDGIVFELGAGRTGEGGRDGRREKRELGGGWSGVLGSGRAQQEPGDQGGVERRGVGGRGLAIGPLARDFGALCALGTPARRETKQDEEPVPSGGILG